MTNNALLLDALYAKGQSLRTQVRAINRQLLQMNAELMCAESRADKGWRKWLIATRKRLHLSPTAIERDLDRQAQSIDSLIHTARELSDRYYANAREFDRVGMLAQEAELDLSDDYEVPNW